MRQRPCAKGLHWPRAVPLSQEEYGAERSEEGERGPTNSLIDTTGGFRSKAACPPVPDAGDGSTGVDQHRFLLAHVPSQEVQSEHQDGCANIHEARTVVDLVKAL
eukprot:4655682-Pyramimonas_sp.AAC.1